MKTRTRKGRGGNDGTPRSSKWNADFFFCYKLLLMGGLFTIRQTSSIYFVIMEYFNISLTCIFIAIPMDLIMVFYKTAIMITCMVICMVDDMAFILDDHIWYFNQLLLNLVLLQNVGENLPLVLIQTRSFEEWYAIAFMVSRHLALVIC
jgi:hypothetical protein